jgi:hypothetical protein
MTETYVPITNEAFEQLALRTEIPPTRFIERYLGSAISVDSGSNTRLFHVLRLLHAAEGLLTETAEVSTPLKRHMYYEEDLDLSRMQAELADVLWYVNLANDAINCLHGWNSSEKNQCSLGQLMSQCIFKLQCRFPDKFVAGEEGLNQYLKVPLSGNRDRHAQVETPEGAESIQVAMAKNFMASLTEKERMEVMSEYCSFARPDGLPYCEGGPRVE